MTERSTRSVILGSVSTLNDELHEFEATPPPDLFGDPIWRLPAYRIAQFLGRVVERDIALLIRARCSSHTINQLERSVGSIGANITERYSRSSGRERARFHEIALGSAREARDWYRRAAPRLPDGAAMERAFLLVRIIKILRVAIPRELGSCFELRCARDSLGRSPVARSRAIDAHTTSAEHT